MLITARGESYHYGNGTGTTVVVRLLDPRLEWRLMWDPDLAPAEGYMDGKLRLEQGHIFDLLELLASNAKDWRPSPLARATPSRTPHLPSTATIQYADARPSRRAAAAIFSSIAIANTPVLTSIRVTPILKGKRCAAPTFRG